MLHNYINLKINFYNFVYLIILVSSKIFLSFYHLVIVVEIYDFYIIIPFIQELSFEFISNFTNAKLLFSKIYFNFHQQCHFIIIKILL